SHSTCIVSVDCSLFESCRNPHLTPSVFLSLIVDLFLFFFNDPAPTEIYTLSLHDALPILRGQSRSVVCGALANDSLLSAGESARDRKSTRLNSSHRTISYAVFCLKKKT